MLFSTTYNPIKMLSELQVERNKVLYPIYRAKEIEK